MTTESTLFVIGLVVALVVTALYIRFLDHIIRKG